MSLSALATRIRCALHGHVFVGWSNVTNSPHGPLPIAYCKRCGDEL